ncbi:MAG: cation-translocating P-type ATPase [Candidatus Heimdallarchaeota archaeon]|nr:cation-translocating P-type ATPase [Candidatus Heimdallarchaeota archaeon]MCK4771100.1 cation-translocating P-type ATPase [Candidatus Heimdallarchaeota archaeon]
MSKKRKKEVVTEVVEEIPWHNMKTKEILKKLGSDEKGLWDRDVVTKLETHGPNRITITEKFKILKMIFEQFTDFLVLLLIAAGFISLGFGIKNTSPGHLGTEIYDAIAIFAIVLINAIIGFVQNFRSNQALEKLKEYFEQDVLVIREGKEQIIHASDLVPGDIVLLEVGEKIPADCRLFEVNSFKVDEAPLTGESHPITKKLDLVPAKARTHDKKNMIFSGCTCVYGRGKAIVVSTGMNTEMGKIAELTQVKHEHTPLQKALDRFGKVLGIIILVICAVVMVVEILTKHADVSYVIAAFEGFETAIALAISAVPEGLPAAIVITLAIGVSRMAKKKTIVSRLPAVETLGSVDYICSDKTGTLTRNEMTVKEAWTFDGKIEVGGSGYLLEGDFTHDGRKIDPMENKALVKTMDAVYHCNNSGILRNGDRIDVKGDPTEAALVVLAEKAGYTEKILNKRDHEIFFDSDRKRMTTVNIVNGKKIAYMKGSPPIVLTRCNTVLTSGKSLKITKALEKEILDANLQMAKKALRVLAVAYKELPDDYNKEKVDEIEDNMVFVGLTGMIDPARPEVKASVEECKNAGITSVMITGDQEPTAIAVAKEIGIIESDKDLIVKGEDFALMTDEELEKIIEEVKVYSRMSPKDKYRVVETLQKLDHIVACTGDGVNDAPAIKKADIGIAMGITGTDVTKETADMVITDDAFSTIVAAVEQGRNIFANMKKFIRYLLSANFDEIFAVLIITATMGILPFLPLQILFLNLLTDALPALALSFDPYDPKLMQRPPRIKQSSFVKDIYVFAVLAGIVAFFASVGIFLIGYNALGFTIFEQEALRLGLTGEAATAFITQNKLAYAQVMAFVTTLSFELWFVFVARNDNETPLIKSRPFKNRYLIFAVLLSWILLLGAVYVRPIGIVFSSFTEGYYFFLRGVDWAIILGFTMGLCLLIEAFRYVIRMPFIKNRLESRGLE